LRCSPPGFRPGRRPTFGLTQKWAKGQARTALAPTPAATGFPVLLANRPRPELASVRLRLTPLKQAGRARWVACLRHAGRLAVLLGGAEGRTPSSQTQQPSTEPQAADCRQRADSWVWLLEPAPLRRRVCGRGRGARVSAPRELARADCLTEVSNANAGSFCPTPAFAANPGSFWIKPKGTRLPGRDPAGSRKTSQRPQRIKLHGAPSADTPPAATTQTPTPRD